MSYIDFLPADGNFSEDELWEAIAEAKTLDDLRVINANFTVDLLLCQEADSLDDLPTPLPED